MWWTMSNSPVALPSHADGASLRHRRAVEDHDAHQAGVDDVQELLFLVR